MAMCIAETCCTVPLCIYVVYANLTESQIEEWKGLAVLRSDYRSIYLYPVDDWIQTSRADIEFDEWVTIGCALAYFLFFGLTKDARTRYRNAFGAVGRWFGISPVSNSNTPIRLQ